MNNKKVDDKPMVTHTKEKPKVHVKGAPEAKIKGRNILTLQHGPKIAGSMAEKSVAADGKIKLKRSSLDVTDKREKVQTKTAVDGMEYGGRNGGRSAQGRNEGKTAQGREGDRNTQGRQAKEQEVRQSVDKENRMYAQYRIAKAEKEAAIKKKSALPSGIATNAVDAGRNLYRSQEAKEKKLRQRRQQQRQAAYLPELRRAKPQGSQWMNIMRASVKAWNGKLCNLKMKKPTNTLDNTSLREEIDNIGNNF